MMQSALSSSSSAVPIRHHVLLLLRVRVLLVVLVSSIGSTRADVVLSEHIMDLAKTSAELSAAVYNPEPNCTECKSLSNFVDEPDQALFAEKDGFCYGVFRGTTMTFVDWNQNFDPRSEPICTDADSNVCCNTRQGFYDAYYASYYGDIEDAVRKCAKKCENPNECVVLTGHSQGGAIAALAAVRMADLNPRVFTFGEPPTIDYPCQAVTSERWYRFVNTKDSTYGTVGVTYDPVPFAPGMGTEQFGYFIMLASDLTGTAFIGLDSNEQFHPLNVDGFEAHSMIGKTDDYPGYLDRIEALIDNANGIFPVRANGFISPVLCTKDIECESQKCKKETHFSYSACHSDQCGTDDDCDTGRCDSGLCLPKLGSCMACDEDSDCAGGNCLLFRCSNTKGKMDNECICVDDEQCDSGRCEPSFSLAPPTCRAQLGEGARCNEHTDCLSGKCSWKFRCKATPKSISGVKVETKRGDGDKGKLIALGVIVGLGALVYAGLVVWDRKKDQYEEISMDV